MFYSKKAPPLPNKINCDTCKFIPVRLSGSMFVDLFFVFLEYRSHDQLAPLIGMRVIRIKGHLIQTKFWFTNTQWEEKEQKIVKSKDYRKKVRIIDRIFQPHMDCPWLSNIWVQFIKQNATSKMSIMSSPHLQNLFWLVDKESLKDWSTK